MAKWEKSKQQQQATTIRPSIFNKDVNNPSFNSIYSWKVLQWKRKTEKRRDALSLSFIAAAAAQRSAMGIENQTIAAVKPKNVPSPNKTKILLGMKVNKQTIDLSVSCSIVKLNHNLFFWRRRRVCEWVSEWGREKKIIQLNNYLYFCFSWIHLEFLFF